MPNFKPLSDAAQSWAEADSETERMEILAQLREGTGSQTEGELIGHLLQALNAETQRANEQTERAERWLRMWKGRANPNSRK